MKNKDNTMFQPYTTDITPKGLLIARNAQRLRFVTMTLWQQHAWLCHSDGSECGGGLEDHCPVEESRLVLMQSDMETC